MPKLNPNERLLVESGVNQYQVVGPGLVWVKPWQKSLVQFYIGSQSQSLTFDEVRTADNVPLNLTVQLLYRVDPALFNQSLLPSLPFLYKGVWQKILSWRSEHVLRQILLSYTWEELNRPGVQSRLERRLGQTISELVKVVGLKVSAVCLVKVELPSALQQTLIQVHQDSLEPRGRAQMLQEYFKIFGADLPRVMPYIIQWELMNTLHKNDHTQLLLTNSALSLNGHTASQPFYQLPLPFFPN